MCVAIQMHFFPLNVLFITKFSTADSVLFKRSTLLHLHVSTAAGLASRSVQLNSTDCPALYVKPAGMTCVVGGPVGASSGYKQI